MDGDERSATHRLAWVESACLRWQAIACAQEKRIAALVAGRRLAREERDALRLRVEDLERSLSEALAAPSPGSVAAGALVASSLVIETQRRKAVESRARSAERDRERLRREIDAWRDHAAAIGRELAVAEAEFRRQAAVPEDEMTTFAALLDGRRILYVGGARSTNESIRHLVERHGGGFRRHDDAVDDRDETFAAAVAWADVVVFPSGSFDADAVACLKRSCVLRSTPFISLRGPSVLSFAAGIMGRYAPRDGNRPANCVPKG